jgi:transcriptional regulator with XRE-family HTH domain
MKTRNIIGDKLRELRDSKKMSQKDIAILLGCTQAAVARYESGASCPNEDTLLWYANYFEASLDYIFGRTESKNGGILKKSVLQSVSKDFADYLEETIAPGSAFYNKLTQDISEMIDEKKEDSNK